MKSDDKKFIYIISNGDNYKIGFSKNPKRRIKQLQTGTDVKLELKYFIEIEVAPVYIIEYIIHKVVKESRIQGEWFKQDFLKLKNTLDYIKIRYDNEDTEIQYKQHCLGLF